MPIGPSPRWKGTRAARGRGGAGAFGGIGVASHYRLPSRTIVLLLPTIAHHRLPSPTIAYHRLPSPMRCGRGWQHPLATGAAVGLGQHHPRGERRRRQLRRRQRSECCRPRCAVPASRVGRLLASCSSTRTTSGKRGNSLAFSQNAHRPIRGPNSSFDPHRVFFNR